MGRQENPKAERIELNEFVGITQAESLEMISVLNKESTASKDVGKLISNILKRKCKSAKHRDYLLICLGKMMAFNDMAAMRVDASMPLPGGIAKQNMKDNMYG